MSFIRLIALALLVLSANGCSSGGDPLDQEAKVYSVLLDNLGLREGQQVLVKSSSLTSKDFANWVNQFEYDVEDLQSIKTSLEFANVNSTSIPLPPNDKVVYFSDGELKKVFDGRSISESWKRFHTKYGAFFGFVGFSRVGFNQSLTHALVYYESPCGKLCGGGFLAYFERGMLGWKIKRIESLWVS